MFHETQSESNKTKLRENSGRWFKSMFVFDKSHIKVSTIHHQHVLFIYTPKSVFHPLQNSCRFKNDWRDK